MLPPNFFATFFEKINIFVKFSGNKRHFCLLKAFFMDIDLLSKMVKELILDDDRVVLPGLGSFMAEIVPSTFSDKGYTINPPYRRLHFRSKPNEGDELIRFYAESNNLDMNVAERIIRDFVIELRTILHSKKTVVFPGLGRLRATKENNIFFVADEDLDIYPAGFGLEPISLKTHQETKDEVSAAVEGLKSLLTETEIVSEPETVPIPETVPEPEVLPVPEVLPEPAAEPVPEPEFVQEPETLPEKLEESTTEPITEPIAEHVAEPEIKTGNPKKTILVIIGIIAATAVLLLIALAVVGRVCPELIDGYMYTPEELKILNHIL